MDEAALLDVLRQALWLALVAIGLVQALTSVQEMTLTFVPKLAAILVAFWLSMAFSGQMLVTFYQESLIPRIIGG